MKPKNSSSSDSYPALYIDLDLIESNARALNEAAAACGLEIVGVVKGVRGDLRIAESMVRAGIGVLADSRISGLANLRTHFSAQKFNPAPKLYALRQPLLSEIKQAVEIADIIVCHSLWAAESLDRAANDVNKKIDIVVPIDLGYGREGVLPDELTDFLDKIRDLSNLNVHGISVISNCAAPTGVVEGSRLPNIDTRPVSDQMMELVRISDELFSGRRSSTESDLKFISGGNSGAISLLFDQRIPKGIRQLTIGEAILLGRDTLSGMISPELNCGAFKVDAEIMQVKKTRDGIHLLLAVGKQEIGSGELSIPGISGVAHETEDCGPPGARVISKISSDHLEIFIPGGDEIENFIGEREPGQKIILYPDYFALLSLMVNPQIKKIYTSK